MLNTIQFTKLQERLLQFLKSNSERYYNPKQLAKALELNAPQKTLLQQALNDLENQNKIKQQSPGTFKYHYAKSALYGVIDFNSRAQAFVSIEG